MYSIQIGENQHILGDEDCPANYFNHSCSPNCFFDLDKKEFYARKFIPHGTELTFNYLTTETEMREKFQCQCGSERCFGFIQGNRYLSQE